MTPIQTVKNIMSDLLTEIDFALDHMDQFNGPGRRAEARRIIVAAYNDAERELLLAMSLADIEKR